MNSDFIYFNGTLLETNSTGLPFNDLALLRGYGVFDFFKLIRGEAPFFEAHWDRLVHSASVMRLSIPFSKQDALEMIQTLYRKTPVPVAGIRITLTGGSSENGYLPANTPNSLITMQSLQPMATGISKSSFSLMSYEYSRNLPEAKTIDYSMGIWLLPVLKEKGFDDVLYIQDGWVSECPRSNIFLLNEDGTLVTPGTGILEGITRKRVLSEAINLMPVEIRPIRLEEFYTAREVFITSTTKGIQPVRQVDNHPIGNGSNDFAGFLYQKIFIDE